MADTRMTLKGLQVLLALSDVEELSGAEIGQITKIKSGTLYPILIRFENAGWLQSRWEEGDQKELERPRRRFYHLTYVGQARSRAAIAEMKSISGKNFLTQFAAFIIWRRMHEKEA